MNRQRWVPFGMYLEVYWGLPMVNLDPAVLYLTPKDGTPLATAEVMEMSGNDERSDLAQYISLNEHPLLVGIVPPDALLLTSSKALSQRSEDASQSSDDGSLSTLEM
ncbi:unnamed protein product [Nippostrongylus brasiliensis]|uniref:UDENN domain-containing protein n=1 Tax=Nippostrongylus brasiliensis TaxID=27835 RepID=A0A0N4YW17_NIPBR|nr:unnamed protein product [Nippostrongylus brasiliensis]